MTRYVQRVGARYALWSSVVDAPISGFMTKKRVVEYLRSRIDVPDEKIGELLRSAHSEQEAFGYNRAGPNDERLVTAPQFFELYPDDEDALA